MAERGSFPHPVLDSTDDVAGTFTALNVKVSPRVEQVDLEFDLSLENPDIERLLDDGTCRIAARWKCSGTLSVGHAPLTLSPAGPGRLHVMTSLPQESLVGRVEMAVFIVASEHVGGYHLASQNPEYEGAMFAVSPGDVLGQAGSFIFDATKSYDPLKPPLESCFRFHRSSTAKKFVKVDGTDTDYVDVFIPTALFDDFAARTLLPELQISSVVLPAVMEALSQHRERATEVVEGGWRATFDELSRSLTLEGKTLIEAAQEILNDPLSKGLRKLSTLVEAEETS